MAEPRDEQWYVDTKRRIREAFQLFDKDRKGCVVQEEVATIMRYLGSYPTERAMVKEILPDMMARRRVRSLLLLPSPLPRARIRGPEPSF